MIDNTGPSAVTGLAAESTSVTVTLSWNDVTDEDVQFFRVEQLQEDGSYTKVADCYHNLGANIFKCSPDTEYTYRVAAYDILGNRGEASAPVTIRTQTDTVAPVITRIQPGPGHYADAIPLSVSAEDDYNIRSITVQVSRDGQNWTDVIFWDYPNISRIRTDSMTFSLTNQEEGLLYVRALCADSAGNVSISDETAPYVQYLIDKTAPSAPVGVNAEGLSGCILLYWSQGSEEDLGKYSVYRAASENGEFVLLVSGLQSLNYYDRSVEPGETWYYKLKVNDQTGNTSDFSAVFFATAQTDTEAPNIASIFPESGSVIGSDYKTISVLAWDNNALDRVEIQYSVNGSAYVPLLAKTEINNASKTVSTGIPMDVLHDSDTVFLRVSATDRAGFTSVADVSYTVDLTAPSLSNLNAAYSEGSVLVSWSGNQEDDLAGYRVYRREAGSSSYSQIGQKTAVAGQTAYSISDRVLSPHEISYIYKVEAVDQVGNTFSLESSAVNLPDRSAPVPVLNCDSVMEVGVQYEFDASRSSDDSQIVSYTIDFGDGFYADTATAIHAYDETGVFTVTLTVLDDSGNEASMTRDVTVKNASLLGTVKIRIVDENGSPVSGASVYFDMGAEEQTTRKTDAGGWVAFSAEAGIHTVGSIIPNNEWLPVKKDIIVYAGMESAVTMTMVHHTMIEGSFEIHRMTFDEIVAAGIDISDPANQYQVQVAIRLEYGNIQISRTVQVDPRKTIHKIPKIELPDWDVWPVIILPHWDPSDNDGDDDPDSDEYMNSTVIAYLMIPTKVSTLKEFFDVELHIINNAGSDFSMVNNSIKLEVPEGLSLTQTVFNQDYQDVQITPYVTIPEIRGQSSETIRWILRGDEIGKHYLKAYYTGELKDFGTQITAEFDAAEPIEVLGLTDMKLTVEVPRLPVDGILRYTMTLSNEGERDVYCPQMEGYGLLTDIRLLDSSDCDITELAASDAALQKQLKMSSGNLLDIQVLPAGYRLVKYYQCFDNLFSEEKMKLINYFHQIAGNSYGLQVEIIVNEKSELDECLEMHLPTQYNNDLAKIAVDLSSEAYTADEARLHLLELGFSDGNIVQDNYNGSLAFTIGKKPYYGDDADGNSEIIVIVARGSQTLYEFVNDFLTGKRETVLGYTGYNVVNEFFNKIWCRLLPMLEDNKEYRFLITGHSLGGAVANILAAQLTHDYGKRYVYCYTFGAIDSLDRNTPVSTGFENIHNIYNDLDTFSPSTYGYFLASGVGRKYGKFGHLHSFAHEYPGMNHGIDNYRSAVYGGLVSNSPLKNARYSIITSLVNIDVYCEGTLVGRVIDNIVDKTVTSIDIFVLLDDIKFLVYPDNRQYDVRINAYDEGELTFMTMDSSGQTVKTGVALTPGKIIAGSVGGETSITDVRLYVINEDGKILGEVKEDGTEDLFVDSGEWGELTWALDNGLLTITGSGEMKDYESSENGGWFGYQSRIESVVISENITSIGDHIFAGCSSLTNVTIPASVISIGDSAFDMCNALTDIYYGGASMEWTEISIAAGNDPLSDVRLHYAKAAVTFVGDNDLEDITVSVVKGEKVKKPADPLKADHAFLGWFAEGEENVFDFDNSAIEEDISLTAHWVRTYTISYDDNGGTGAPEAQVKFPETPLILSSIVPTRENYDFIGWATTAETTTALYQPGVSFISDTDTTLYAVWQLKQFTITWLNDDNTVIDTTTVEYGTVPTHAEPEKAATAEYTYTFAGWTPEVKAVTEKASYKATFTATKNSYQVTWLNDDDSVIDTTTVEYGAVPTHADPEKAATAEYTYTFAGWTPEVKAVTEKANYKATFTATKNSYTVTWLNDDNTVIDTTTVEYGAVPTHADPEKTATAEYTYTFAGWSPEIEIVTGNTEYTAIFIMSRNVYTVSFDTDAGTPIPETQLVEYGSFAAYPDINPAKTGSNFVGWYLNGEPFRFASTPITGDTTLTARWRDKEYTIVWLDNDSTFLGTTTVTHGETPTYEAPFKQTDAQYTYEFAAWVPAPQPANSSAVYRASYTKTDRVYTITVDCADENGSITTPETALYQEAVVLTVTPNEGYEIANVTYYDGSTHTIAPDETNGYSFSMPAGNVTVAAVFSKIRSVYTVSFDADGGTPVPEAQQVKDGSYVSYPDTKPTKDGSGFMGWYLNDTPFSFADTPVTGDITLTAKWWISKYTIIWLDENGAFLDATTVNHGEIPTHEKPVKQSDEQHIYVCRWDPAPQPANGTAVYRASYTAMPVFGTPNFTLPKETKTIEESAFEGLNFMTVVEIPNGCESIGRSAFKDCTGLTQIRIPASVISIDDTAFDGCTNVLVYGRSSSTAETFCEIHTNCTFVMENSSTLIR